MSWTLKENEKTQEQLDAYKRKLMFKVDDDNNLTKKTVTLASVIHRMVFRQQPTYYVYEDGKQVKRTHQCEGTRRRSVEDIYSVAKNYVKKPITRVDVEKAMDRLIGRGLVEQNFCGVVKRRVHSAESLTTSLKEVKEALKGL